jgi:hypothetical protein
MTPREKLIAAGLLIPREGRQPRRIDAPTFELDDAGRKAAALRVREHAPAWQAMEWTPPPGEEAP